MKMFSFGLLLLFIFWTTSHRCFFQDDSAQPQGLIRFELGTFETNATLERKRVGLLEKEGNEDEVETGEKKQVNNFELD